MAFSDDLIHWYLAHKRDLPFRGIRDPYRIWISEVVLQQTRMEQGIAYYNRFIHRFPDVGALALASEEEVLHVWQGLGYYSRARHLHAAARHITNQLNGRFPDSFTEIKKLPGIGEYTAASVASLAFREAVPAIDGNVYRFFARYTALQNPVHSSAGKKKIIDQLALLIDRERPDLFNQAMIEYGALVCTPRQPRCPDCFLQASCAAYLTGRVSELPVRKTAPAIRIRYFYYLVISCCRDQKEDVILLKKRTGQDIWKNLYEFPLIECTAPANPDQLMQTQLWKALSGAGNPVIETVSEEYKHLLSHQEIRTIFIRVALPSLPDIGYLPVAVGQLKDFPFPRLITRYFDQHRL